MQEADVSGLLFYGGANWVVCNRTLYQKALIKLAAKNTPMEEIIGLWGCTWTLWIYNADQSWPAKELNPQNENGKVVEQYFATFDCPTNWNICSIDWHKYKYQNGTR